MLIPRIGRQLTQVGIQQQYHPFHIHFWLEPTRQFGFRREIQNSVINRGINQSTKRTIRVFGISVVASIGLGVSAFASPRVLCEGMYFILTIAGGEFTQGNSQVFRHHMRRSLKVLSTPKNTHFHHSLHYHCLSSPLVPLLEYVPVSS